MAEEAGAAAASVAGGEGKMTMVVGVDESEHSYYALQWTLLHFSPQASSSSSSSTASSSSPPSPRPRPPSGSPDQVRAPSRFRSKLGIALDHRICTEIYGSIVTTVGAADVLPFVEADLKRSSLRVIDKVSDAVFEVVEGDARNVLCEAVERHHAEMLVVGNHGYGAIKRAVLGSVSDYCTHHAH